MGMTDDLRRSEAVDWMVRTNDPDFGAWDDFTAWLERDPANADAYHALAGSEAEMLPLVEAARDADEPARRRVDWLPAAPCRVSAWIATQSPGARS